MEWTPSQHMNTVDLKAVIASWGLYAPHGAEKPELRAYVSEKYQEIMAERVKHTSILVQSTVVCVDKSVGTDAPQACTTYIGSDEPISTFSLAGSSCAASDGDFRHVFAADDPLRTPFRVLTYEAAMASASSSSSATPKTARAATSSSSSAIPKTAPKAKSEPKPEKPGRVSRDNGNIYV